MGKNLKVTDPKDDSLRQNPGVGVPKQHPNNGVSQQDHGEMARAARKRQEKTAGKENYSK